MTGRIVFKNEQVLQFFLQKGLIATIRQAVDYYARLIGKQIDVVDGSGNVVGKAEILAVFQNIPQFRKMLVKYSSFKSVEDWEKTAIQLHGSLPPIIVLLKLCTP